MALYIIGAAAIALGDTSVSFKSNCTFDDCTDYCAGTCPFTPNISTVGGKPEDLTVYRLTPGNITDLVDHNTGDALGDLGFMLKKYLSTSRCIPPYNNRECFLDYKPLVAAFNVTFDGSYGPYLRCNPDYLDPSGHVLNMSKWVCAYGYPGADAWEMNSRSCQAPCQRANVSVGKDPALHHFWFNPSEKNLLTYFGGYWYSTPKLGECKGSAIPGDGSGCTWKIRNTPKYINASCLADRLFAKVELQRPECFKACPSQNRTNPCYVECFEDTVLDGISKQMMVETWEAAFDDAGSASCPKVAPEQSTKNPDMTIVK